MFCTSISFLILPFLILLPLVGGLILLFIPTKNVLLTKQVSLFFSSLVFFISLFLWLFFDKDYARFQFVYELGWIPSYNLNFSLGIDGISLFFVLLTTLLIPICLLASWNSVKSFVKEYLIAFLFMETLLVLVFCVKDLLLFYIFFESVLIPMFVIIGVWGSRERKIRAAYLFFLYTLVGSVLMLLSILYIYFSIGTTDYEALLLHEFSLTEQKFLYHLVH